jgi:sn-glycerol 3-phosphate transport system substrate-binding protein
MKKQFNRIFCLLLLVLLAGPLMAGGAKESSEKVDLKFYYPVNAKGDMAQLIEGLCKEFSASHPSITVEPIYSGNYPQTLQRILTGHATGNPGDIGMLDKPSLWAVFDEGALFPMTDLIAAEGKNPFTDQFFKIFMEDCTINGEIYALPFQRSTAIIYYNKDMFRAAGLDPEKPPATWAELKDYARKLAIKRNGTTERWGIAFSTSNWIFKTFLLQNGGRWRNDAGTKVYLDTPEVAETVEFLKSFIDEGLAPAYRDENGATTDVATGAAAMNPRSVAVLGFMRESANFDLGTAALPSHKRQVCLTGGANLVMLKGMTSEKQKAAWEFFKWLTAVERAAQWCIDTGFLAPSPAAWETPLLKEYIKSVPLVLPALKQLDYAEPEPMTHQAAQINSMFSSTLAEIYAGQISVKQGLSNAQAEADKILAIWQ